MCRYYIYSIFMCDFLKSWNIMKLASKMPNYIMALYIKNSRK